MATLQLDEIEIAYETAGEGVSIVFIHEAATDQRIWERQRAYFRQRYRALSVDILGHGRIAWSPQEVSIEQAAHRVQQLLERLGIGSAFMVGVSMGAAVAMHIAFDTPALVRGLGLVSPWNYVSGDMQGLINRLFRLAEAGDMAAHTDLFLRYSFPALSSRRYVTEMEWLRSLILEQNPWAVAYTWVACLACDLRAEIGQIKAPSLIIAGLSDLFAPPYLAREVAEGLAEVELEIWEETGHFPFLEDPGRFNRRLELFIQRCLVATGSV
ncbi:MAG TPA: alpha/beta fold hydrolase [Candidatus Tectomicrobia bacterium]|nr:alpha/beta fold hydrolase [Candidatus Tectomicrobia bacterium]